MSSNGNKGRFSNRLKKMRRDRLRIRKYGRDYSEDDIKKNKIKAGIVKSFVLPISLFISAINPNLNNDNHNKCRNVDNNISKNKINNNDNKNRKFDFVNTDNLVNIRINRKNSELIDIYNNGNVSYDKKELDKEISYENENIVRNLEKEILDLLKKRFIKDINELEILQSDLYILSKIESNDIEYKECQDNIKEIKKLISKVRTLKEEYDYLKDNYDFEYLMELSDNVIVDKIILLRELCSNNFLSDMVKDYKLLDEYKYLYTRIDLLEEKANEYRDYKDRKIIELKERDIDFEKFKDGVINIEEINKSYNDFIDKQNIFLTELEKKVGKINNYEEIEYRLVGFNKLLGNSFKYMGLLLLNPLNGLLPVIATETMMTRNILHNLRRNLRWEEYKKMKYDTINYSDSITYAINNIDDMCKMVDSTLEDIVSLKQEFNNKFSDYQYQNPEYKDTIRKLNKMENAIVGNKIKLDIVKERLMKSRKVNTDKMIKVKKLNND